MTNEQLFVLLIVAIVVALLSGGPNAFLPSDWVNDFISVKLKHQQMRNQEIRALKHQERLREIADLKARFGITD